MDSLTQTYNTSVYWLYFLQTWLQANVFILEQTKWVLEGRIQFAYFMSIDSCVTVSYCFWRSILSELYFFARGRSVIRGTVWKKIKQNNKNDEWNRNLLPKVTKIFSLYYWTCKLHFCLSKIFIITHKQEFHKHRKGVNFSCGRDLGILLWNSGKWWFSSFLFQLIVQIQGHCGGVESGPLWGKCVHVFFLCFLGVSPLS